MPSRETNLAALRSAGREIAPGQKYQVDDFRPEDAEGIAALFYAVYGERFAVDCVYDPDELRRQNAAGEAHHVVGRTGSGDVVGLYALFRHPPGRHIMEVGSWIVAPGYRNTTLAMRLAQRIHHQPPERLGLNAIFGQSVCDHLITQKMAVKFSSRPCALEIEVMPPRPEEASWADGGRISLLDSFIIQRDVPHAVSLPAPYAAPLGELYAARGLRREFIEDAGPVEVSDCTVAAMDAASQVRMNVAAPGRDLGALLERMERERPGRHVYQLCLPMFRPGLAHAVDAARRAGYFLAGLLPLWDDRDALLLQKLTTPPDLTRIQLHGQESRDILNMVMADRASLPAAS